MTSFYFITSFSGLIFKYSHLSDNGSCNLNFGRTQFILLDDSSEDVGNVIQAISRCNYVNATFQDSHDRGLRGLECLN